MQVKISSNLRELISKYQKMRKNLLNDAAKAVHITTQEVVTKEFEQQKDPYGKKWPKDKTKTPFDPNHVIENSFKWSISGSTVTIESDLPYAIYHQTGTDKLPQRMMLPDPDKGFGKWEPQLDKAIDNVIKKALK